MIYEKYCNIPADCQDCNMDCAGKLTDQDLQELYEMWGDRESPPGKCTMQDGYTPNITIN